ncbi:HAD hydrolase-like protein [Novosphingobium sp. G106]|uniref:HAD hydrolase-like protein n=1 Tax=Novosphingobium sp. G106 TaxID=2849500 RepID=UPI001C2CDD60|nr:HAD hydrolase-like protein [Novosphingobium sp. G106]MBV1692361.1 HAD hydrolase-like protein [Novosphingobium sp. G106]
MYDLIVFDFDGTLADSADWLLQVLPDLADRHRFRAPAPDEIEALRGCHAREVMAALRIPAWRVPAIARDLRRLAEADAPRIPLFAGIPEVLSALASSRSRLAVVSSNSEVTVRAVLGQHAASISAYACGAALFGKARLIRRLVGRSGIAFSNSIYVGDELRDIAAARSAGVAAGAAAWGYATREALALAQPDHMFDCPENLSALAMTSSE